MANELPLFYRDLVPFDSTAHASLTFPKTLTNFKFAAQTNLIPVFIGELADASRHYPLVFIPTGENQAPVLTAVVGVGDGVNRFVNADGQWREGCYIPAYVRRYPFIALRNDNNPDAQLSLGFDKSAEGLGAPDGDILVGEGGKPSERLEKIMQFEAEFQRNADVTREMAKLLQAAGVLEESNLQMQLPGSTESKTVSGFLMVNEKRLRELADDKVLGLFKSDCLALAYGHLFSLGNIGKLMNNA